MNKIALPQKIEFIKGDKPNQGMVVIEPCYPGYGTTLGTALRRVLLSSLEGAAVVGVKIKGADHEFMALPHIKEDVLELILNFKQIRLKVHSDEVVKLELSAHGEKEVTAADIKPNSQVEIVNKDLHIAEITDMAGNWDAEIYVARGRGYETLESRENEKKEIGYISMDSIYSPIMSVGINIENTRVGKMTNWDKLILDIITDGTISVEDAFAKSVEILMEQFGSLILSEPMAEINEEIVGDSEITTENSEEDAEDADQEEAESKKKRGRPKKI